MTPQVLRADNSASSIRDLLLSQGYAVAQTGNRDGYLEICGQLGNVTQTREIFIKPKGEIEKFTGYSHQPEAVPFHTDYPLINVVGLYCEQADGFGGENLLIDSREVLSQLSGTEVENLRSVQVPLPKKEETFPLLTQESGRAPHIYWLPALCLGILDKLRPEQAAAVRRFDQALSETRQQQKHVSIQLKPGEAVWFDNFMMLHGRDQLDPSSKRFLVRAFIESI